MPSEPQSLRRLRMKEKKRKVGRPKLPKTQVKHVVAIRLTNAEKREYERMAERAGLGLSDWIRQMDMNQINLRLHEKSCFIQNAQVNKKGRFVYLVQPWDVAMFQEDIVAILSGTATLEQIIARNRGADLADPW